ncbi:hypothetical protein GCK72_000806 [Caenorhabditis remanei]|uniref:MSP domain-containing protein n=1 Tax=Caenorhabditis remanei TaxID=31234 RepID=A0A6A5HRZ8_CAERE|nr:hypothetical protein GCK72_000806 [Caenorhabditis remanei]KAF1768993.1 hypothetical protein GCK72_000806 [Caenorhabditis remanei]
MAVMVDSEKKVKDLNELSNMKLQCSSPDRDLIVYPRWLCFTSQNGYKTPLFVRFFIENRESYPVTYLIKTREKCFRIDSSCGILKAEERKTIKLYLMSSDDWPLAVGEYTQRRIKMAIECLRLPDQIEPATAKDGGLMAKTIWKKSVTEWPLERLYTKINVFIFAPTTVIPTLPPPPPPSNKNSI